MSIDTQRVQYENKLRVLLEALSAGTIAPGGTILATRLSIINYVKAKLDELVPEGEGITIALSTAPNITNPYDLLINGHLDEATKNICMSAPLSALLPTTVATPIGVSYTDTELGYVLLPVNFIRLSSFKMVDWIRNVSLPISTSDPQYNIQKNEFLRGGPVKPIAVLNWKNFPTGGLDTVAIAAGGTGYTPGNNVLTVVQSGAAGGTINATASSGGIITAIASIKTIGTGYTSANGLATTAGAGANCTINLTQINGSRRILEYYSVLSSHTVEHLMYIPELVAEDLVARNPDLLDSLAWMTAGKILQILGLFDAAKMAADQVKLSYFNL